MYDASGERVIKSTGDGQTIYINGFPMGGSGVAGNYTMYVNPFMVVNNMKLTSVTDLVVNSICSNPASKNVPVATIKT